MPIENEKHLDDFLEEYGFLGNLDHLFNKSITNIKQLLQNTLLKDEGTIEIEEEMRNESDIIACKGTSFVSLIFVKKNTRTLLVKIPSITKLSGCYFIIDGVKWMINNLEIPYPNYITPVDHNGAKKFDYRTKIYDKNYFNTHFISFMDSKGGMKYGCFPSYFENVYKSDKRNDTNNDNYLNLLSVFYILCNPSQKKSAFTLFKQMVKQHYSLIETDDGKFTKFIDSFAYINEDYQHETIHKSHFFLVTEDIKKNQNISNEQWNEYSKYIQKTMLRNEIYETYTEEENKQGKWDYLTIKIDFEKANTDMKLNYNFNINESLHPEIKEESFSNARLNMFCAIVAHMIENQSVSQNTDLIYHKKIDTAACIIERVYKIQIYKYLAALDKADKKEFSLCHFIAYMKLSKDAFIKKIKGNEVLSFFRHVEQTAIEALSERNKLDVVTHARKIKINTSSNNPNVNIKKLTRDQFGYICIFESTTGAEAGVIKFMALTSLISERVETNDVIALCNKLMISGNNLLDYALMLNGYFLKFVDKNFATRLREKRRNNNEIKFINITRPTKAKIYYMFTDRGRFTRPLLQKFKETEEIVYIDVHEFRDIDSKFYIRDNFDINEYFNQYKELNGIVMIGLGGNMHPLSHKNQAARNIFQTNISKQIVETPDRSEMFKTRVAEKKSLWFGESPHMSTYIMDKFYGTEIVRGINCLVAIAAEGFNQDDGIIMKKEAIERGLFAMDKIKYMNNDIKYNEIDATRLNFNPPSIKDIYAENGLILNYNENNLFLENGSIKNGSIIHQNTVVRQGYTLSPSDKTPYILEEKVNVFNEYRLTSKSLMQSDKNTADQILNLRLERSSYPIIGDKFAARCANKSIIAQISRGVDMPFTKDGVAPDIIINPHSIPTRMTYSYLQETQRSRELVELHLKSYNGTAFYDDEKEYLDNCLDTKKIQLYNPRTGLPVNIECGLIFYHALKHQSEEKYFHRRIGPTNFFNKQPTEGRKDSGGLRFGNMEIDALVAHNSFTTLETMLIDDNDKYEIPFCGTCHHFFQGMNPCSICNQIPHGETKGDIIKCSSCEKEWPALEKIQENNFCKNIKVFYTSYILYLTVGYFQGLGIEVKCNLTEIKNDDFDDDLNDPLELDLSEEEISNDGDDGNYDGDDY